MEGIIYIAENIITKKNYIGQTMYTVRKRKMQHFYFSDKGGTKNYFHNSIRKHGKNNFIFKELLKVEAKTKSLLLFYLNILEDVYIEKYDTFENGYNLKKGGNNTILHESARRKISESKIGKKNPLTDEQRKKHYANRTGLNNHNYGKNLTDETKKKISESKVGKLCGACTDERKQKLILANSKGKYITPWGGFYSANIAGRFLHKSDTAIYEWCINNLKIIKKMHVTKSKHIFKESDIGKTFKEFGFSFEANK